jgi:hypothetical protein
MTTYPEETSFVTLRTAWKNKNNPVKVIAPYKIVKRVKNKEEDANVPFEKYIMPLQPKEYIKCPKYDFF